jgi:hypothetical protein
VSVLDWVSPHKAAALAAEFDRGFLAGGSDMATAWKWQEDALHTLADQWESTAKATKDHAVRAALKTCAEELRSHIGVGSEAP